MERRMRKMENKQKRFQLLWRGSILYALFYTACLYHNASGITYPFLQGAHSYFGIILQKNVLAQIQKTVTRTGSRTRHSFTKHF